MKTTLSLRRTNDLREDRLFKRRVLYFVNDASFFLSHRLPIACAAQAAGMEVHVATPRDHAVERIQSEGFHYHAVPISRWHANPFREIASVLAIRQVLREVQPDILHNVTIKPVLYGSLAARSYRKLKVVNAISGLGTVFVGSSRLSTVRRSIVKWLYRRLLRRGNVHTIFQNPDDLRAFLVDGIVERDQTVIIRGSGVDLQRFAATPVPDGIPVVVLAARMLRDKGVEEFVRAAYRVQGRGISAKFVLVGDSERGNPAAIPEARLEDWRRAGIVEWWGQRRDMPNVFAQAHVVCLPSYREGLPKVLIEAAACGRPVVATDVPGCREVVRHGVNGLLVPVRDEEALASAIAELLQDRARAEAMGKRGRQIAEVEFDVKAVVHQTLELYERVLQ
ncbi:MAG TPA: glycosyltransferase family 4 protein [Candidatus Eisenbacteria bacterium]|nr:glycosyltransferase family 4 protein [Candidatus Eisenbacteria bacterium]